MARSVPERRWTAGRQTPGPAAPMSARRLGLSLLRWTGLMRLWRFRHRHHVIILYTHGVVDSRPAQAWVPLRSQLALDRLDAALRRLARHYRFISLDDAVEMLAGRKPLLPYSLVLTFDDGYRNNITHALPLLRRHRVPATIYLATGHVEERRPFWFDRLDYALQHAAPDEVARAVSGDAVAAGDREGLRRAYKRLRDEAKAATRDDSEMRREMEGLAAALEAGSGRRLSDVFETDHWAGVASWAEVRAATGPDVTWGSHTVDHVRLGQAGPEVIRDQLARSRDMIEAATGAPCRHFAYPSGSVTPEAATLARQAGYTSAVTTKPGTNRRGDDLMTLRRIGLPDTDSELEVLAQASGLSDALAGWKARRRRGPGRAAGRPGA